MFTVPQSSVNPKVREMQPPLQMLAPQGAAQERWRRASKSSAVAAAETLRESIWPR